MMRSARQRLAAHEKLHVLAREDVVGDHAEPIAVAHRLAQRVDERGLPRTDRSADADAHGLCVIALVIDHVHAELAEIAEHDFLLRSPRALRSSSCAHDRNNRECRYCCVIAAMSIAGANDSMRASRLARSPRRRPARASSVRASNRVRLGLADRHQAHRRGDRSPRAACTRTPRRRGRRSTPAHAHAPANATGSVGPSPSAPAWRASASACVERGSG